MTGAEQKEFYGSFMKTAIEKFGKARQSCERTAVRCHGATQ
jgi:hypothetical protein